MKRAKIQKIKDRVIYTWKKITDWIVNQYNKFLP
jgi:hypothetical protein